MAGLRVLVVEDNEKNMKLFRDVLQAKGYDPLEAVSGEEAVEHRARPGSDPHGRPASGMDGIEALGRIRADERTSAIPVVALTAQAMAGDRERFLEAGFDGYISKPVDVMEFIETVGRYPGPAMDSRNGEAKILVVDDIPENVRLMEAVLVLGGTRSSRRATGARRSGSSRRRGRTSSCST